MPAYDTVKIKSPALSIEQKDGLLHFCDEITKVSIETGEIKNVFTTGQLEGSYDYRIRIVVDNKEWVKVEGVMQPVCLETDWYVIIECSIHKLLCNHNVFGGPQDIKKSIKYLIKFIHENTNVEMPNYLKFYVERIDVAKIFVFSSYAVASKIIENLKKGVFNRRKMKPYPDGGVMASGSTSTVKFYPKGSEFEEHDYKRFNKYIAVQYDLAAAKDNRDLIWHRLAMFKMKIENILERGKRTIRFETEIKIRKLKELFNSEAPTVEMMDDSILFKFMEEELRKCIKENEEMDIVRRSDLVKERLENVHGLNMSIPLYYLWVSFVEDGEKVVKEKMKNKRTTFYKYRKMLYDAGVSWVMSNINLKYVSIVPDDFTFLNDKYVDDSIDVEVIRKLEEVA